VPQKTKKYRDDQHTAPSSVSQPKEHDTN